MRSRRSIKRTLKKIQTSHYRKPRLEEGRGTGGPSFAWQPTTGQNKTWLAREGRVTPRASPFRIKWIAGAKTQGNFFPGFSPLIRGRASRRTGLATVARAGRQYSQFNRPGPFGGRARRRQTPGALMDDTKPGAPRKTRRSGPTSAACHRNPFCYPPVHLKLSPLSYDSGPMKFDGEKRSTNNRNRVERGLRQK